MSNLLLSLILGQLRAKKTYVEFHKPKKRRRGGGAGGGGGGGSLYKGKKSKRKKQREKKEKQRKEYKKPLFLLDYLSNYKAFTPLSMGKYGIDKKKDPETGTQASMTKLYNLIHDTGAGIIYAPKGEPFQPYEHELPDHIIEDIFFYAKDTKVVMMKYGQNQYAPTRLKLFELESFKEAWKNTSPEVKGTLMSIYMCRSNWCALRPQDSDTGDLENDRAVSFYMNKDSNNNWKLDLVFMWGGKEVDVPKNARVIPMPEKGQLDRYLGYAKVDNMNLKLATMGFIAARSGAFMDIRKMMKETDAETGKTLKKFINIKYEPKPFVKAGRRMDKEYEGTMEMAHKVAKADKTQIMNALKEIGGYDLEYFSYSMRSFALHYHKQAEYGVYNTMRKFEKEGIGNPIMHVFTNKQNMRMIEEGADRLQHLESIDNLGIMDEIREESDKQEKSDAWEDYGKWHGGKKRRGLLGAEFSEVWKGGHNRPNIVRHPIDLIVYTKDAIKSVEKAFESLDPVRFDEIQNPVEIAVKMKYIPADGYSGKYKDTDIPGQSMENYEENKGQKDRLKLRHVKEMMGDKNRHQKQFEWIVSKFFTTDPKPEGEDGTEEDDEE